MENISEDIGLIAWDLDYRGLDQIEVDLSIIFNSKLVLKLYSIKPRKT